ncbi:hypothetical protein K4F52_008133 [Lecanicillium sp. MT-2017a]|nr:hypothetical protein K4F52_008133 [Lecanicillium sp. MT-2017a]
MDKMRYLEFGKRGQLRDVTFRKPELFSQGCWQTNNCESLSEAEGNLHFEAGEYYIHQYGHKINQSSGLHRVVVTLERLGGQKPLEQLADIPRPSQVDDWYLFEKYEGEMVKKRQGKEAFTAWKVAKAKEKIDYDQWKQVLRMTAELKLKNKEDA